MLCKRLSARYVSLNAWIVEAILAEEHPDSTVRWGPRIEIQ